MKTCRRGHVMSHENTYERKRGGRTTLECRQCRTNSNRKRFKVQAERKGSFMSLDQPYRKRGLDEYSVEGLALLCGAILRYKSGSNEYSRWLLKFMPSRPDGGEGLYA